MTAFSDVSIEAACSRIIDYRGKTPPKSSSGVRLVTAKVIKDGRINEEPAEYIEADFYDAWMRRGLPVQWDVLITTEAPLGEVAVLRTPDKVALAQRAILLRGDPKIVDQRYLFCALRSPTVQTRLVARATGTTVLGIKQSELRQVLLPLPNLQAQRRIASILGAYDDLIEVNRRRIAVLEEMARRLFEEWFVHFRFPGHGGATEGAPTGPPTDWQQSTFGALVTEHRDTLDPTDIDTSTTYIGLEHIPRRSTTLAATGSAEQVTSTKLRFARGDILFGKIRPYFHKVAWAPFDGICSTDAIVWRPRSADLAGLALAVASSDAFVAHSVQTSNGTKMPRANSSVLLRFPVLLPAIELLRRFNENVMANARLAALLQAANLKLASSRDLLLPRLISGDLPITTAERDLEAVA